MKTFLVYWYHLADHTDPHSQGYVGVTCQNVIRRRCHIAGRVGSSKILNQAFKKYGEQNVLQDILHTVDTQAEAYELEMAYRPRPLTGWNIAIGGGLPPDTTGRKDPPEVRMKRAESVRRTKANGHYPNKFKGVTGRYSEEQKAAIGAHHRGKQISDAHRRAITEKNSGDSSPKAKEVFLVHRDTPAEVRRFACIKTAASSLGIPYNTLRSQAQRTLKNDQTSEPSRTGWICLSRQDAQDPVKAVSIAIATRQARMKNMTMEREANRKAQGTGVASGINR